VDVLHTLRSVAASAALAGMAVGGTQLVAAPLAQAKFAILSTTATVNLRQSPSTSASVLTVVQRGTQVTQTGNTVNGWTPVRVGARTGWIYSSYLATVTSTTAVPTGPSSGTNTATVTESVNLRTGPGTNYAVVRVLRKGTTITLTGVKRADWVQVNDAGKLRWVHKGLITTKTSSTTGSPAASTGSPATNAVATSRARASTALMIRTSSDDTFTSLGDIPTGTILELTGVKQNGVAQVIWQGHLRWVNANFLVPISSSTSVTTPAAPVTTGTRYASVALDIRTASGSDARTLAEVPAGTKLAITGVVRNGRAQIVYNGAVRWVTARYLSLVAPTRVVKTVTTTTGTLNTGGSVGLDRLTSASKGIVAEVRANYPQITTMYGVRADSIPDHPSGRAVDIMLPSYRSNEALGWAIANHMRNNARALGINYVIFHQHIWSVARNGEGWRLMANRGGDTANHYDHVHVTVN